MVYIDQLLWPQGKKKAFTLSYDDGVTQDLQLIDLFGQYGVKATFNLNPGLFGDRAQADIGGRTVRYDRLTAQEIPVQYAGQDIAAHGWHHVFPDDKDSGRYCREILKSREALEDLLGHPVIGYAYPYGQAGFRIRESVRMCGIGYARTTVSTHAFTLPEDFLEWNPTCHHDDNDLSDLADRFLSDDFFFADPPVRLMYVWGHSFEFDINGNWDRIEQLLRKVSGKADVWYASNTDIYRYVTAWRRLEFSLDSRYVYNPTDQTIWLGSSMSRKIVHVPPGTVMEITNQ